MARGRVPLARSRVPMIQPPRQLSGGGAAPAFGTMAGPAPLANSRRGRLLALQYADDERGRFTERVFTIPQFSALAPGGPSVAAATQQQTVQMVSNRTSFVRLVAMRGVLQLSDTLPLNGLETANLTMDVQLDGEENLFTSGDKQTRPPTFAELFATDTAPWFWFAAPPRLRVGDTMLVEVTNTFTVGTDIHLTPAVSFRIVDDRWWQAMYGQIAGVEEPEVDDSEQ